MKSVRDYLEDILVYLHDIDTFTATLDQDGFKADRKTQLAVIRAFEVIGEIVKRLPQALLDRHPDVDWRAIKGFRDVLIHQYDNLDLSIVWDAVGRIREVSAAIEAFLASLPADDNGSDK